MLFIVTLLGCGKRFVCHWSGDNLDPGKWLSDVVLAGNMADVRGELRDEIQMIELAW